MSVCQRPSDIIISSEPLGSKKSKWSRQTSQSNVIRQTERTFTVHEQLNMQGNVDLSMLTTVFRGPLVIFLCIQRE